MITVTSRRHRTLPGKARVADGGGGEPPHGSIGGLGGGFRRRRRSPAQGGASAVRWRGHVSGGGGPASRDRRGSNGSDGHQSSSLQPLLGWRLCRPPGPAGEVAGGLDLWFR
jgi:hypothetical protein